MRRVVTAAAVLLMTLMPGLASAQQSISEKAAKLARDSCTVSSIQGSRRTSDGKRLVTLPGSNEEIEISKERWNGIQQVLREHQQQESANYRDCVRDLARMFLEAEKETQQQANVNRQPQQNGGTCAYENDGFCDVPGDCPYGTDLNDCAVEQQVQQNPFPPQQAQLYCCDYVYGQKWCAMTTGPFGVGLPCVCAGVAGSGFQCY